MPSTTNQTTTQQNWISLKRIALAHFKELRVRHPGWSREDLFSELTTPVTALLDDLAEQAGFRSREQPHMEETNSVVTLFARGVWCAEVIAEETGIPLERVKRILEVRRLGYGSSDYGDASYGGKRFRGRSRNGKPVLRKVTVVGQMTYANRTFTLGKAYSGRIATVTESRDHILVVFSDRPALSLCL